MLLFCTMTRVLDLLEEYLDWRGLEHLRMDGATGNEERGKLVERFNEPGVCGGSAAGVCGGCTAGVCGGCTAGVCGGCAGWPTLRACVHACVTGKMEGPSA